MSGLVIFVFIFGVYIAECASKAPLPNFVVLLADDMGYGDVGSFGHPTIRTPQLDMMASQGMRLTQWYSAFPACSPSRAALLTGRLPIRTGVNCVLTCPSVGGIASNETMIPKVLKHRGYASAAVGKWHLGQQAKYLPTRFGFDSYYGIPYSADMGGFLDNPCDENDVWCCAPLPLYHNETIVQQPVYLPDLEPNHAQYAVDFITRNQNRPFFLYVAFAHTHVSKPGPWEQWSSPEFEGTSARGKYGDAMEEMDWCVGEILNTLRTLNLDENTLVLFTSDNGPWLFQQENGGSAGLFRNGKGTTWEGGLRMPGIAWWPGTIPPMQVSHSVVSTMDLFPTIAALAGAEVPRDRVIDGRDISDVLLKNAGSPHDYLFFYNAAFDVPGLGFNPVFAMRWGAYKAHFVTSDEFFANLTVHDPPLLFNVDMDPSEQYPLDPRGHLAIIDTFRAALNEHNHDMVPAPDACGLGSNFTLSPCCNPDTGCICGQVNDAAVHASHNGFATH